jgi:hypothetical protein
MLQNILPKNKIEASMHKMLRNLPRQPAPVFFTPVKQSSCKFSWSDVKPSLTCTSFSNYYAGQTAFCLPGVSKTTFYEQAFQRPISQVKLLS